MVANVPKIHSHLKYIMGVVVTMDAFGAAFLDDKA